jgi:LruC domain-containing protein
MKYLILSIMLMGSLGLSASWNSDGVPDVMEPDVVVSNALLSDIDRVLPERGTTGVPTAHPEFFSGDYSSNVYLNQEANVFITFVHEGAGYRNSFGYFTYTADNIPSNASEVVMHDVFPNASRLGSGGGLETGDTVKIGPFPAGTFVGFWVKANAWDWSSQTVGEGRWKHFTLPHLNTETDSAKRGHVAMFWHEESERLIMGFEDIKRDLNGCDQDFNDLIFFATTDPVEAMDQTEFVTVTADYDSDNDGIPDSSDVYPDDDERASVAYYPAQNEYALLAFEDNFPLLGDYDFNDLVVNYSSEERLSANGNLKELIIDMKVRSMGALYFNGFAIQFPFVEADIQSASLLINGVSSGYYPIEAGHINETVVNIMHSVPDHIDGAIFPNTLNDSREVRGDRFQLRLIFNTNVSGVSWPYNPFLFVNQDRGREIHLMDYTPTESADSSFFGTLDDVSNIEAGLSYRDSNGMPFAMLLPSNWKWPEEFVDITNSYPHFTEWAESAGVDRSDWATTYIEDIIWSANDLIAASDDFNNDSKATFWQDTDFGSRVSMIEEIDQTLKMTVAASDLWKNNNQYASRYTPISGDFDVSVKVVSQENTHPWAKAGIMVKENMATAQNNLCNVAVTPSNGFAFQYDWQNTGLINGSAKTAATTQGANNYLRMQRIGDSIYTYARQDTASEWILLGSRDFTDLPESLHVGLFAVSHAYEYGTVVFDDWIMQ